MIKSQDMSKAAADEEQASFSSEPLLKQDLCDPDNSSDAINTWWLGRRSTRALTNDNGYCRKNSIPWSNPDCLRRMTAKLGFRREEKSTRGHKTRCCARIGLGTLILL